MKRDIPIANATPSAVDTRNLTGDGSSASGLTADRLEVHSTSTPFHDVRALAADTTLLHIGPRKSGTTAIQSAFHLGRAQVREAGVLYPGHRPAQSKALRALRTADGLPINPKDAKLARAMQQELADWRGRTLLSAEMLEHADADQIESLISRLNRDNLQVLITARPISKQLPSLWQQLTKRGKISDALEPWIKALVSDPDSPEWHGQRVDWLSERWGRIVGLDRVHVMLVDPKQRAETIATVERLLGLAPYALQPARSNRGMTMREADMARALRRAAAEQNPSPQQSRDLDLTINRYLAARTPAADEMHPAMPRSLRSQTDELQARVAANLATGGYHLIGDLGTWQRTEDRDFADLENRVVDLRETPDDPVVDMVRELLDAHADGHTRGLVQATVPHQSAGGDEPRSTRIWQRASQQLRRS